MLLNDQHVQLNEITFLVLSFMFHKESFDVGKVSSVEIAPNNIKDRTVIIIKLWYNKISINKI